MGEGEGDEPTFMGAAMQVLRAANQGARCPSPPTSGTMTYSSRTTTPPSSGISSSSTAILSSGHHVSFENHVVSSGEPSRSCWPYLRYIFRRHDCLVAGQHPPPRHLPHLAIPPSSRSFQSMQVQTSWPGWHTRSFFLHHVLYRACGPVSGHNAVEIPV